VALRDALERELGVEYEPREFWEDHADRYVSEREPLGLGAERLEIEALTGAIVSFTPRRVLEVGCAYGRIVRILSTQGVPAIVGVDISHRMLVHAQQYLAPLPALLVESNAMRLPFADRSFDVVYTYGLMMHVPPSAVRQVAAEITRVARKGVACLETALPDSALGRRSYAFNRAVFGYDYERLFKEAGWQTVATGRIGQRVWFACRRHLSPGE
jgi:ubiquinone/menaquinone biosynthesis C-methylase UbiE